MYYFCGQRVVLCICDCHSSLLCFCMCVSMSLFIEWSCELFGLVVRCVLRALIMDCIVSGSGVWLVLMFPLGI